MLLVVLAVLAASAAPAQQYDTVASGVAGLCSPVTTPYIYTDIEWLPYHGAALPPDTLQAIAAGPEGRIFAVANVPNAGFYIAQVDLGGKLKRLTPTVAGLIGHTLVVARSGGIYATADPVGDDQMLRLVAFDANGSHRATWTTSSPVNPTALNTSIDLAADQCTLFRTDGTAIRRFNVCTGTPMSDFAAAQARAIRILPDGGLIASAGPEEAEGRLDRYGPNGQLASTTLLTGPPPRALALAAGGSVLKYDQVRCEQDRGIYNRSLENGSVSLVGPLEVLDSPRTLVAYDGWTAALGATHHQAAAPSNGSAALIAIAVLLVMAAVMRLR